MTKRRTSDAQEPEIASPAQDAAELATTEPASESEPQPEPEPERASEGDGAAAPSDLQITITRIADAAVWDHEAGCWINGDGQVIDAGPPPAQTPDPNSGT